MKLATTCAAFLMLLISVPVFGQKPTSSGYNPIIEEKQNNEIIRYALKNAQQEGCFYFLPFPPQKDGNPFPADGFRNYAEGQKPNQQQRAKDAQIVLRILADFELMRKVEVVSFQLIRDQGAHFSTSVFHGIFLRIKSPQFSSKSE